MLAEASSRTGYFRSCVLLYLSDKATNLVLNHYLPFTNTYSTPRLNLQDQSNIGLPNVRSKKDVTSFYNITCRPCLCINCISTLPISSLPAFLSLRKFYRMPYYIASVVNDVHVFYNLFKIWKVFELPLKIGVTAGRIPQINTQVGEVNYSSSVFISFQRKFG